jgi:hypothetical protein
MRSRELVLRLPLPRLRMMLKLAPNLLKLSPPRLIAHLLMKMRPPPRLIVLMMNVTRLLLLLMCLTWKRILRHPRLTPMQRSGKHWLLLLMYSTLRRLKLMHSLTVPRLTENSTRPEQIILQIEQK